MLCRGEVVDVFLLAEEIVTHQVDTFLQRRKWKVDVFGEWGYAVFLQRKILVKLRLMHA